MATLKDIANLAGVSQATVSNVLNGCGNVSSKKIRLVEAAAAQLGYTVNERAKLLRKGSSNILALVIPDMLTRRYNDIYTSFKVFAEQHGYSVSLYLTDDISSRELEIITKLRSDMVAGVAAISCLDDPDTPYLEAGFFEHELLFLERGKKLSCNYIGFDYELAGYTLGSYAAERNSNINVMTEKPSFYNGQKYIEGFRRALSHIENISCKYTEIGYDQREKDMISFMASLPEAGCICSASFALAEVAYSIMGSFFPKMSGKEIYTISPLQTLPESIYKKYELDYSMLGHHAALRLDEQLKNRPEAALELVIPNAGFRIWEPIPFAGRQPAALNLLMLNGPEATAVQSLSRIYTERTGTTITVSVASYDEMFEILSSAGGEAFDILRIDITFLSWFAQKLLVPLRELDPDIDNMTSLFIDGISERYSTVAGKVYALPFSPSVQLLYYRKDLFESTVLRRLYYERYRRELAPPRDFTEFNRIAAFFTRKFNPDSPTEYGASLTLGSMGVAASEFMARLMENRNNLYDDRGIVCLNGEDGLRSIKQLIELKECAPVSANAWWTDTAGDFAAGKLAMAILYSNYASDLLEGDTADKTKIGCTHVPGNNPILGGASLGIAKTSKRQEPALNFIKWLCSETVSSAATFLGGASPCKATYNNYKLLDALPWLRLAGESFSIAKGYRRPPEDIRPFDEKQFLTIIGMAVKNAYNGVQSPAEVLGWAQREFDRNFCVKGLDD